MLKKDMAWICKRGRSSKSKEGSEEATLVTSKREERNYMTGKQ